MIINYLKPKNKKEVKFYLKIFKTIIFAIYNKLDIGFIYNWIYAGRL